MESRDITIKIRWMGETGKIEKEALKFISPEMNGLDIGSGGAPILLQAIGIDREYPAPYSEYVHLKGDAGDLYWFKNNCMDYIFSSHCLEDFEDKAEVLREWIRVLKEGGLLLLYLPDEKIYRELCKKRGQPNNLAHKDAEFSLKKLRKIVEDNNLPIDEIYCLESHGEYCFFIVYTKGRTNKYVFIQKP